MSKGIEKTVQGVIYVVLRVFPEVDMRGEHGRHYRVVLPGDIDYKYLDESLKRGD